MNKDFDRWNSKIKIIQTTHFKERIWQRNITIADVVQTINFPDHYTETIDKKIKVHKHIGSKNLVVIYYKQSSDTYILITTYYN